MILLDTFKDTIFLKESSELQKQYLALTKLIEEYPNNEKLKEEYYNIKKGYQGENEIAYQLEKSNLGLYVLHDIHIEYENLKAQIDFIVVTKSYCYFIECKNLTGNITIDEKGDFIKEYTYNNKKIETGIPSPLRQVEAQRDVYKKIWNTRLSSNKIINNIKRLLAEDNFTTTHKVLVIAANNDTILNTKYAPLDIKYKVIKVDQLIRKLQYDLEHSNKEDWMSKKAMEKWANTFLNINIKKDIDYYQYYKNKYCNDFIPKEELKNKLIEFRKNRAKEIDKPAYYIFDNDELDKLVELTPKTLEELKQSKILTEIRLKMHGQAIIDEINKMINN